MVLLPETKSMDVSMDIDILAKSDVFGILIEHYEEEEARNIKVDFQISMWKRWIGILVSNCESGDCGHWIKQFQNVREIILRNEVGNENFDKLRVQLTNFDYNKVQNAKKEEVTRLVPVVKKAKMTFCLDFLLSKLSEMSFI